MNLPANHDTRRRVVRLRDEIGGIDAKIDRMQRSRDARARALQRLEADLAMEPFTSGLPDAGRRYIHGE